MLALLAAFLLGAAPPPAPPAAWGGAETSATVSVQDSLTYYYARQDTSGVDRLYRRGARTQLDRLLCLYRLFPMTLDEGYLDEIPASEGVRSARELALISALWAYKAASGPKWALPARGRRSERILNEALRLDSDEPYALLVKGQGLYYKPRIFGGNVAEAQRTFERLRQVLARRPTPGIHPFEAEVWIWMAVRKQDAAQGAALGRRLLAGDPPRMFRQFLVDPP
ncbi:hypothetical protein RQM47_13270 [Rubrivirga sp. S365]|uniref:Uncharacterized protein n=1 Tax=Rubrivirga litoralis TaxID=3075598 RepID=A0ABU3BVH6_9BACT|nr:MULTISPECIES: hypothetical protein [unclassified Rubrivirga]MDT0633294.1 hypothetical protein [Rubrivirga sp. F394]MDT7857617.1 hypothetical protein [Rubrivirga sp. S365]